jgi:hypothetical protein
MKLVHRSLGWTALSLGTQGYITIWATWHAPNSQKQNELSGCGLHHAFQWTHLADSIDALVGSLEVRHIDISVTAVPAEAAVAHNH